MCSELGTKQMSDREAVSGLRHALQAMTEEADGARHAELLRELSREHPNTIKILESIYPLHRYTCFVHAFGFTERPQYVSIAQIGFNYVYASPEFAHWLFDHGRLSEIAESDLVPNDLAFYFSTDGRFQHTAIFFGGDRFQSKWGRGSGNGARLPKPDGIAEILAFTVRLSFELENLLLAENRD